MESSSITQNDIIRTHQTSHDPARRAIGRSRRRSRGSPASGPVRWTLAFLLGLGAVAVAAQGSPAVYDDVLFSAHMVQHLLLIMAAPPLLIAGRPVTLLLHVTRNPMHTRVKHILRSRVISAL